VITHIHNDHAYMLRELAKKPELVSRLKVERFIWNRPNEAHMTAIGDGLAESAELLEGMLGFEGAEVYTARAGQVYYIRNAVYTVYSTSEMLEPYEMASYNDACVVGLLEIDGCRIFFPGDSDRTQTKNLVKLYGEELRCDVLQVIHHGHNGGDTEAYMLFDPITVLWPVGSYRYSQEWDGNLPFSQWPCNEWFFDENSSVENIYVAGKDVVTLVIKDLPVHK
jgi:beta-lactamase superfamily II metal-dependent hydrolase